VGSYAVSSPILSATVEKKVFLERCTGGAKNVNFWKTVKPFFSKKCNSGDQNIILCEDNKIINDTCEVSEKFVT
jgi:hypothetical protein